jgi:glutathione S-transferase
LQRLSNQYRTGRLALAFKGLPFKTIWVEFPDIADVCKKIGASPTAFDNGSPVYTLPVIQDPSTGKVVSDSWTIAEYLDENYPDRPSLFPKGTRGLQWSFISTANTMAFDHWLDPLILPTYNQLPPRSQEYFRPRREKLWGCRLEEISTGEQPAKNWADAEAGFTKLTNVIAKNGEGSQWFLGDTISYLDLFTVAELMWIKQVLGGKDWERARSWDGGFWGKFVDIVLDKYAVFDDGVEYL